AQMLLQDGQETLIVVHGVKAGARIHPVEQPGRRQARTRAKLEKAGGWFRSGKSTQQRARTRLGCHVEARCSRVGPDCRDDFRFPKIGEVIHWRSSLT